MTARSSLLRNKAKETIRQKYPAGSPAGFLMTVFFQPWEIAPVGQTPAQVPQSMHFPASMLYCESPWEIAPTGHSGSQVPQLTQESLITYAMITPLLSISVNVSTGYVSCRSLSKIYYLAVSFTRKILYNRVQNSVQSVKYTIFC